MSVLSMVALWSILIYEIGQWRRELRGWSFLVAHCYDYWLLQFWGPFCKKVASIRLSVSSVESLELSLYNAGTGCLPGGIGHLRLRFDSIAWACGERYVGVVGVIS